MFGFLKRGKSLGKPERPSETTENRRPSKSDLQTSVAKRLTTEHDVTKESTLRKDVVNLLIPETDYCAQKTGVGAIIQQIMAGKKKKGKRNTKISRAQSCREISPPKETNLQRSHSELDPTYKRVETRDEAVTRDETKNTHDESSAHTTDNADPANFVKALVLQKYANKSPVQAKKQHVSLVYVSPDDEEKRHAETLLREIARSIDCTIEGIKSDLMGTTDSKPAEKNRVVGRNERVENVYETVDENKGNDSIINFKNDLKDELHRLIQEQKETEHNNQQNEKDDNFISESDNKPLPDILESPIFKKKSNLKVPKSDNEACSDDDRSDNGKKKVTFRKHIVFDDGDQQTDDEIDSSFVSLTSSEEETEEETESEEEEVPDNDELLGGIVVTRSGDNDQSINKNDSSVKIKVESGENELKRISSDNSDSGFLEITEISDKNEISDELESEVKITDDSDSSGSEVTVSDESDDEEEILEKGGVIISEIFEPEEYNENTKNLVSQESKFQHQVAQLNELSEARCGEAERMRDQICRFRKDIEAKDLEIEHLKCELAAAYKESELIRQRSRSLEEELVAARGCSADLASKLSKHNDEIERQLRSELEEALTRRAELESKLLHLENDRERLEQEKRIQEKKAEEALTAAEANTAKWRTAHEAARSQAAARAERMLSDCEWKMRELEKRARDTEKKNIELTKSLDQLRNEKSKPSSDHIAELQQLRGLATEQQRSVQSLAIKLQKVETREEALKLEVHRLKELLEKEARISKEKDERHMLAIEKLEQNHTKTLETVKAEHQASAASTRAALERVHAERTRAALAQLRTDSEKDVKNSERKLREVTTRFENLKTTLSAKEAQFEKAICEAHSKADWELLQLRHLLDKADINYANSIEKANEKFENEKESLIEEWSQKLKALEEESSTAAEEARKLLENTRIKLIAEKTDQVNKLKEEHRKEMDEQWEQFMTDKENCLSRMKAECRLEGEEDRIKREKDLLEEIAELKSQIQSKSVDFDTLAVKTAACGRTLAVTEQELREALERERELRGKRSEDATKIKQVERASKEQIEHLTRKCACLRKLFDDMRNRLSSREKAAEQESRNKDKELHHLRAEVARLTKILVEQSSPKLGARTRADGCDAEQQTQEEFFHQAAPLASNNEPNPPRRKGGTLRTPEFARKNRIFGELAPIPPELRLKLNEMQDGRRRAKSVDLPAVQVPVRIKQLEEKNII